MLGVVGEDSGTLLCLLSVNPSRGQDLQTKKQHIPLIDRTPLEPPPVMVAVVGPPKVGKTTLINCLIKSFTRQPLSDIKGPVTIVSGKRNWHQSSNILLCQVLIFLSVTSFRKKTTLDNHGM